MEARETSEKDEREALRGAVVLLVRHYLEEAYYKRESQLDTNEAFKDDAAIVEAGRRQIEKLTAGIGAAEDFLEVLEAD